MSYESRGYDRPRYDGRYGRAPGGGGGRYYRDDRRHYGGRKPYQRRPSPTRDDEQEDIEGRLRSLIIKIGDKITEDLRVNLQKMRNILDNDYSKYPTTVDDTLKACITELPAKAPVYGTLLGLLNVSKHEAVEKLMMGFNDYLAETAQKSDWFKLKQFLRFYGELMNANVITSVAYCGLINDVLAILDENGQPRRRLDCAAYIVMATLPWSAKELQARCPDELQQIMSKLENYMSRRGQINSLDALRFYCGGNYEFEQQDMLAHLWTLLQGLQLKNWEFPFLPKPHKWFDEELSSPLQHDIPRLQIPEHTDDISYIFPERPFRIYVDDAGLTLPSVPKHDSLEYFILQDIGVDVMRTFEANRKECAKYLLAFLYNFAPGHFQVNKKREDESRMDEDANEWALPDLLLEVVFSQVLRLPTAPFRSVYYTCVLSELCRGDTDNFPKALGRCVKTLYERLPDLDTECVYRLSCWFAHHLSNFGFQWDWAAWEDALDLESQHPKAVFIRETLEKLIRLSYYERVKAALPQKFHAFLPPTPPGPDFEYKNPEHPLHQAAKQVVEYMRAKKHGEDIRALLENFKEEQANNGVNEQERSRLASELFLQSMLIVGSKSFSHVLNIFERYLEVLRCLNNTPEGRLHTVQTVAKFWKNNSQFLGILLDKLLNYRVIDPNSISTWAFEKEQLEHPDRTFVWEILENTLSKVVTRVDQVQDKLDSARKTHEENEAKRAEAPLTEMAQAEAQQELDTLRIIENSLATVEKEQREVFITTFEKFTKALQDALAPFPPGTADTQLTWSYKWIMGWFRSIMRMHYKECSGFLTTMETVVFTNQVDDRITSIFSDIKTFNQDFCATV